MITLKDLEVGNWIDIIMNDSKPHYVEVVEKDAEKISVLFLDKNKPISIYEVDFKEALRGILISERILPKCGFIHDSIDNSFVKYRGLEKQCIVEYLGEQGWGLKIKAGNSYSTNLYEIHQLQNLYNELTEEKLILNL